jgi:hypothetical protein
MIRTTLYGCVAPDRAALAESIGSYDGVLAGEPATDKIVVQEGTA